MKPFVYVLILFMISPAFSQDPNNSPQKKEFNIWEWFQGYSSKDDRQNKRMKARRNKMMTSKIFNSHMIFGLQEELANALIKTEDRRTTFEQERTELTQQIKSYETQLMFLLEEQRKGIDRSQDIVTTYKELYSLNNNNYQMLKKHTEAMADILSNTYQSYNEKTQQKITEAEQNPELLVNELLNKFNSMKDK